MSAILSFGRVMAIITACLLMAAPAAAQQHLFCTDANGAGLFWDAPGDGEGRVAEVAPETFTVNIVAPEQRLINKGTGGIRETRCHAPDWPQGNRGLVACTDVSGGEVWLFNGLRYTRSYLLGTPLGTDFADPNITVAHGTCRPY